VSVSDIVLLPSENTDSWLPESNGYASNSSVLSIPRLARVYSSFNRRHGVWGVGGGGNYFRLGPLFGMLLAHQSAPSALIVEDVKANYGHESARETFWPVSSALLIVLIQQTFRFSRNPSHYPN
jgi:hypothetical protein